MHTKLQLGVIHYDAPDTECINTCKQISTIPLYIISVLLAVVLIILLVVSIKFLKDKAQAKSRAQNSADDNNPQASQFNLNRNAAYSTVTVGTNL